MRPSPNMRKDSILSFHWIFALVHKACNLAFDEKETEVKSEIKSLRGLFSLVDNAFDLTKNDAQFNVSTILWERPWVKMLVHQVCNSSQFVKQSSRHFAKINRQQNLSKTGKSGILIHPYFTIATSNLLVPLLISWTPN